MPAPPTARELLDALSPLPADVLPYAVAMADGRRRLIAALGDSLAPGGATVLADELREPLAAFLLDAGRTQHHAALLERALGLDPVLGFGATARLVEAWRGALGRLQEAVMAGHTGHPTAGFQVLAAGQGQLLRDAAVLGLLARELGWARMVDAGDPSVTPSPVPLPGAPRFRDLVSQLPVAVLFVVGGRIVYANPHAARLLGVSEPRRLQGARLARHLSTESAALAQLTLRRVAQGGAPGALAEWWFRRAASEAVQTEIRALPMTLDGLAGVVVVGQDITDVSRDRARFLEADRRATMGLVASSVVHEVGNPLTVLSLALQELRKQVPGDPPAADTLEMLEEARDAAARIRRIVRDVKVLAQPDGEPRALPMDRVLERAVNLAWPRIRGRARLVKDYAPVPHVRASEGGLTRVFLNLLDNAAHAIPDDGGRHEIRLELRETDGGVEAAVRDTGGGLSPGFSRRAFAPFVTTRPEHAAGLGLAIARGLVERWGGTVRLEDGLTAGAIARVWLPIAPDAPPPRPADPASGLPRGRVLLIEPDRPAAAALSRALGGLHDVAHVVDVAAGRADLSKRGLETDAVVCALPAAGDAEGLVAWLRRAFPELARRLVFLTPGTGLPQAERLRAEGPHLFLDKPVDIAVLRRFLDALLELGARSGNR
jgi:signal transduction histidine kinase